jgi:hypothetical protein
MSGHLPRHGYMRRLDVHTIGIWRLPIAAMLVERPSAARAAVIASSMIIRRGVVKRMMSLFSYPGLEYAYTRFAGFVFFGAGIAH